MIRCIRKINAFIFVFNLMIAEAGGQALTVDNLGITATAGLTMTISGDFRNQNGGTIDNAGTITVSGDWTNNAGNNVFSTNSGDVQLIGTSALQTINGATFTSFYNLTLNNSCGSATRYTLGTNQTVKNTLTLSAGIMDLAGNTFTLGSSAALPGSLAYGAGWMYDGTITRWFSTSTIADGAAAGLFPLGTSADYRPLYVTAPSVAPATGGTISVTHTGIAGTTAVLFTDLGTTIDRIFNSYWLVIPANGLSGGTYNMRVEGTGFTGITDYTLLRLTLAGSSVGTNAANAGSNANPQVNRTGLTVVEILNIFRIGYPAIAALPVELLTFNALPFNSEVRVNWSTASEINSDYFTVERSADGELYEHIATVQGAGNSTNIQHYSAVDNHPLQGTSFYRLKQTDFDGSFTHTLPVTVHFENTKSEFEIVAAYFSHEHLVVTILSSGDECFELDFYDCIGKLISHHGDKLMKGYHEVILPFPNKAAGMYLLTVKTPQRFVSKKVFKK